MKGLDIHDNYIEVYGKHIKHIHSMHVCMKSQQPCLGTPQELEKVKWVGLSGCRSMVLVREASGSAPQLQSRTKGNDARSLNCCFAKEP